MTVRLVGHRSTGWFVEIVFREMSMVWDEGHRQHERGSVVLYHLPSLCGRATIHFEWLTLRDVLKSRS